MSKAQRVSCLQPVYRSDAKVLVLGSMPGVRSLELNEYYAHPRNHFWAFMELITRQSFDVPYAKKINQLTRSGIALWDVLQHCTRKGSLDSDIRNAVANPITSLIQKIPTLKKIILNGRMAEKEYRKHFSKNTLVTTVYLPSTSPANAGVPYHQKAALWQGAFKEFISAD